MFLRNMDTIKWIHSYVDVSVKGPHLKTQFSMYVNIDKISITGQQEDLKYK